MDSGRQPVKNTPRDVQYQGNEILGVWRPRQEILPRRPPRYIGESFGGTQTLRGSLGVAGAWLGARRSGRAVQEIASVVQLGPGNWRGRVARGSGGVNAGGPDVWRVMRQRLGVCNAS